MEARRVPGLSPGGTPSLRWGQPSGPAAGRAEEQPLLAGPAAPEAPRGREAGQGRPRPPPQPAGLPSAAKGSPGVSLRESPPWPVNSRARHAGTRSAAPRPRRAAAR